MLSSFNNTGTCYLFLNKQYISVLIINEYGDSYLFMALHFILSFNYIKLSLKAFKHRLELCVVTITNHVFNNLCFCSSNPHFSHHCGGAFSYSTV
jgi:hypothetical protein